MLKVIVYVGDQEVARAVAENASDLADVSAYDIRMNERAAEELGIQEKGLGGRIEGHKRDQTVWALVRNIADMWLLGTGVDKESAKAKLLPVIRKSIREKNDGFSDLVDDLWGKLDTDPER